MSRLLWLPLLLASCATAPLQPDPGKLLAWTTTVRDSQPEDAFAAVYKVGANHLVFVGAKHANRVDSATFRLIEQAFDLFAFDIVLAEGFATSRGANPPSVLRYAAESRPDATGFVEGGETVPTALGAQREGAVLLGGEPDDLEIKSSVIAAGLTETDLLGFYVLRNVPQWISERKIDHAGDPRLEQLVVSALAQNQERLKLSPTVLPSFAEWAGWYRALNGQAIGQDFITEEVGPLADGRFGTNRIAYAVSRARDAHLHRLIINQLKAGKNVLVVFGASHLMIHRPALDATVGRPCFVGADLRLASPRCS